MNNKISNNDKSFYDIELLSNQYSSLFSKKKLMHIIYSELEKKHPFFGAHCTIKYKIVLEKKKLHCFVTVFDTIILATKEKKRTKIAIFACLLVFSFFVLCASLLRYEKDDTHIDTKISKPIEQCSSIDCFLSSLHKLFDKNVVCNSFNYSTIPTDMNILQSSFLVTLEGVYPEELYAIFNNVHDNCSIQNLVSISNITFVNDIPNLVLSFNTTTSKTEKFQYYQSDSYYLLNSEIRKIIRTEGGSVQSENISKKTIDFIIPITNWNRFYKNILTLISNNNSSLSSISLKRNTTTIVASITVEYQKLFNSDLYIENLFSFEEEVSLVVYKNEEIIKNEEVKDIALVKIGSITRSNGSIIEFEINENGNLISKEENNEE